jgi:hypothetical protein
MRPLGFRVGCRFAAAVRLTALGWLVLAGGCAPGLAVYDKPGITYEEWRRDDADCHRATPTAGSSESQQDAYARCMKDRGYHTRAP